MPWEMKKPTPKPAVNLDGYTPSYTAVAGIFQKYLRHTSEANLRHHSSELQAATIIAAKEQLELELEQIGLAKHIAFDH